MWDDTIDMTVNSREDLIRVVKEVNENLATKNITRKAEEKLSLVNLKEVLRRYDRKCSRDGITKFRKEYDCKHCIFFKSLRSCKANGICLLENDNEKAEIKSESKVKCPKDIKGDCPYGNNVGTCFNFCWRDLLE